MRVGIDTFTIRELKLDPFQTLEFVRERGFEGAQFGGLRSLSDTLDPGKLREIRSQADSMNLYTHVSVPGCNPHLVETARLEAHKEELRRQIEAAAACGWHELHSALGGGPERYEHPARWTRHLHDSADLIRELGPVLRAHGSRIDLETHGDATTFELVRLVEDAGPDIAGICLDTANVLCHAEDPVLAAWRAAPYTHLTHLKDGILFFSARGYTRQGRPPGGGILDWPKILPILAAHSPDLPLSIEDHKWLFEFAIFETHWIGLHPDLTREELARVVQIAWECQRRIHSGEWPGPDAYETRPFLEEMEERLSIGRDYLKGLLDRLGLRTGESGRVA
jgi:sugar phosphate isomerase/epimerase